MEDGSQPGNRLTRLEQRIRTAAAAGGIVDLGGGPFAAAQMEDWPTERTVRAAVLRCLLVDAQWPVTPKGVRLRGVRVRGQLDLDGTVLRCPLSLDSCYLDASEPVCLDHASASHITLTGCRMNGLTADMLTAREIDLSRSVLTGPLRLLSASIAGQLICRGVRVTGLDDDGDSVVADGIRTGGSAFFDEKFTAAGAVRLTNARIGHQLDCRGARLTGRNKAGIALMADGIKTDGSVLLHHGFKAAGTVRLAGADITGQLSCRDAELADTTGGIALMANGITTSGDVLLDGNCFKATGAVRLAGADIGGQLRCAGNLLGDSAGNSIVAEGMKVADGMFLDEKLTVKGTISLRSAHITGRLELRGTLAAGKDSTTLFAPGMQVTGTMRWAPAAEVLGVVELEGATVGELDDDWTAATSLKNGYWPACGRLNLRGFEYGCLGGDQLATPGKRLDWIRSQYLRTAKNEPAAFAAQPYEQLAAVWRRAGEDTAARKAAIARRTDLRTYGNLSPGRRLGNWLLDVTIKYGYQTWRAGAGLAVVFVLFLMLSIAGQHHHAIAPTGSISGLRPKPSATGCTDNYPCFYPVGYTVDTVIPIINVHQADYWGADGNAPWGWIWVSGAWVATGLGWAMATLLVAGYTGLVRQQ